MRVAIAEDSGFMRDALADALTTVGVEVAIKVDNIDDLFSAIAKDKPDVALLDICLPPTKTDEGLVAAERLGKKYPDVGVLVLSAHLGMAHVSRSVLSSGRRGIGCLSKDQLHDSAVLVDALDRVANGGTFVDPEFVEARFRMDNIQQSLTPRELEILRSIAQGLSNQAIADLCCVNIKTIESSITSIFRKLGIEGGSNNARVCAVLVFLGQKVTTR